MDFKFPVINPLLHNELRLKIMVALENFSALITPSLALVKKNPSCLSALEVIEAMILFICVRLLIQQKAT